MSERRILVIEESRTIGKALEEYVFSQGSGFAFSHCDSVSAGLDFMSEFLPNVVVSAHDGSDRFDGRVLLGGVKARDIPTRVVLCADESLEADRNDTLALGADVFLVRPWSYDWLGELVCNMLRTDRGFRGRVLGMRLEDVVEMLCFGKDSTRLSVFHGSDQAAIYIHDGAVIHAAFDNLEGVEAVYEILGWESGEFHTEVISELPVQTVFIDWQSLLMEGVRQKDEIRHALGGEALPAPAPPDSRPPAAEPSAFGEMLEVKRIMVVDDSRMIRKIVQEILLSDPDLEIAGFASNGREALARMEELKPDLIILDWDMPVMMGSTALMHIMIRSACPVVMLSSFLSGTGSSPFDLLCLGAVDFMRKPQSKWRTDGRADDLIRRVKDACNLKVERIRRCRIPPLVPPERRGKEAGPPAAFLVVLGSFVGGCADLLRIIPEIPVDLPAAVAAFHDMQPESLSAFIHYLDERSHIPVRPARPGAPALNGVCYLHPAAAPLELIEEGDKPTFGLSTGASSAAPIDGFLASASQVMGKRLLAALFSGGASRGITGLREVRAAGGVTMVQQPSMCLDPRMAEAALGEGLVDHVCSADDFAATLQNLIGVQG